MGFRPTSVLLKLSVSAVFLWLSVTVRPCAAADIPAQIRQALESNARALSPITIAWERTRTSDLPRPKALSMLAGETSSVFLPQESRLMWDNGRFYADRVSQSVPLDIRPGGRITELKGSPPRRTRVETAFDGQKSYCGTKTDVAGSPPVLVIDPPTYMATRGKGDRFHNAEFLYHCGLHIPERAGEFAAKEPAKSLPLYLIEHGASVVGVGSDQVDGVKCTTLDLRSAKADIQFLLDPAKGYAVRRRVEKTMGELAVRADSSNFIEVPGSGLWMPKTVEVEWHIWPNSLTKPVKEAVVRETFRVSELNSKPIPPTQFVLKYDEPGTTVADGSLEGEKDSEGRVTYRVPADPSQLDEVIKSAAAGKNYRPTIVSFRRNFIIANVLLILIVIGVVWWRVGRKSR